MSFRLKVVLLILSISLLPYSAIMFYMGTLLEGEYRKNTISEMSTQLDLTTSRIEQYLKTLQKDMLFMSKMDVMIDVLSDDLDKRIALMLLDKKRDLHLIGDFYVTKGTKIVSSSNFEKIGTKKDFTSFMTQEIHLQYGDEQALLSITFSLDNLTQFFNNTPIRNYYIVKNNKTYFKETEFVEPLKVSKKLTDFKNIEIILQENKDVIEQLLSKYKKWYILTMIFGFLLISIVALLFVNRLIKPVINLSEVAQQITKEQDYSHNVKIESRDEIGELSKSFNHMINSMAEALEKLRVESENKLKLTEEKSKNEMLEQLSSKLSRYLSPQIYKSIFLGEQDVTLSSKRKKLTIFFSDIEGFTDTTDSMESEDLSELLNDYLNGMTLIALEYGATVDKYIGDAIMLFFGDPESQGVKEDAINCIQMAIKMQKHMSVLHQKWIQKGFTKPFKIRIGINTGYCTVGNFGSENRLEYTIIGSPVNLASRIESLANPSEVLISEDTYLLVKDYFTTEKRGSFTPKGFVRPIDTYSVKYDNDLSNKVVIEKDGLFVSIDPTIYANSDELKQIILDRV